MAPPRCLVLLTGTCHRCVANHLPGTHVTCVLPRMTFPHPYCTYCEFSRVSLCLPVSPFLLVKCNTHLQLQRCAYTLSHTQGSWSYDKEMLMCGQTHSTHCEVSKYTSPPYMYVYTLKLCSRQTVY